MTIATPYALPFEVHVPSPGVLARGEQLQLTIGVAAEIDRDVLDGLAGVVTAWAVLASTGALAGEDIPAAQSTIADHRGPIPGPRNVAFALSGVRVDDRAAVVLAHLLHSESEGIPVSRVHLAPVADPTRTRPLPHDPHVAAPYPGVDRTATFARAITRGLVGEAQVLVRFAEVLADEARATVELALSTWAATATGGAYAVAPVHPLRASVVAEPELEWVDDEAAWGLSSVRLHPGAFDGLVNVVAALHQRGLPVALLSIE